MASRVDIVVSAIDRASKVFSAIGKQADEVGKRVQAAGQSMVKVGGAMTAGLTLPIAAGMKAAADAAYESQKIAKVTEQVIKSTGGAAKVSAAQVDALATALSNKTAIDDEQILKGQQVMLTFTRIRNEAGKGNDIFNRASAAMLDLGTVFGSTDAAAMQLGKALNDPVKGIGALSRAGVTFTAEQKKLIQGFVKQGDVLSAQKIILAEVEGQVGGTAAASATAYDRMKVAVGNFQESIGALLIPIIEKASRFLADLAARFDSLSPSMQRLIVIGLAVAAAIGPIVAVLGAVVTAIGFMITPVGLVVVALAALVAGAVIAYQRFEGFRQVVDRVAQTVRAALPQALEFLRGVWTNAVDTMRQAWARWGDDVIAAAVKVAGWIQREVLPTLQRMWDDTRRMLQMISDAWARWGDDILRAARAAIEGVLNVVRPLMQSIGTVITAVLRAVRGDWSGAWDSLKDAAKRALEAVVAAVQGLGKLLFAAMQAAWGLLQSAWNWGRDQVVAAAKALPGLIKSGLGALGKLLYEAGRDIVQGLVNGVKSMAGAVADAGSWLAGKVKGAFTAPLKILSPSRVFHEYGVWIVQGLVDGVASRQNEAEQAMLQLADRLTSSFENAVSATRSAFSAYKNLGKAQDGVVESQELLNEARARSATIDQRITDAQARVTAAMARGEEGAEDLRKAEEELGKLRDEKARLPREIADATRRLTDAQESLTDATLANFDAARKLAEQGPNAVRIFEQYARQAGVAESEIRKIVDAANAVRNAVDGIPSFKQIAVSIVENVTRNPQYDPGSQIPTSDPGVNSGRRIESDGTEYVWIEGIGWVKKGGSTAPAARANGGSVMAGSSYLVGERGPELFTAGRSGYITPNDALGSGGGPTINIEVHGSVLSERDLVDAVTDGLRRAGWVRPDGTVRVR